MAKLLCALAGLFLLAAPASASLSIAPSTLMLTPDCVTYKPASWLDRTKPTECLVVKKKQRRHVRHKSMRHFAALKSVRAQAGDFRGDFWRAIHDEAIRESLWREFQEWKLRQQAPSP